MMAVAVFAGCGPGQLPPDGSSGSSGYNNLSDPTNRGAAYIGAGACGSCHPDIQNDHLIHGHANILTPIEGSAPEFPAVADRAGVPAAPGDMDFGSISYVIGGYTHAANYLDLDGFLLVDGVEGVETQWNLSFPVNGTMPDFAPYEPQRTTPKPYDDSCFQCHTTGAMPQDAASPTFQENRPGIVGTWMEAGVQCEACHGPGSNHAPNPAARDLFVDSSAAACGSCHTGDSDPDTILAADGFIHGYEQWSELRASGGHADFSCTVCHDPHRSTNYDRDRAIRNDCTVCHVDMDMALHEGTAFVRGNYGEFLDCESCHMPFATRFATSAGPDVVGERGHIGDTRTHIFRIDVTSADHTTMFSQDGSRVIQDSQGRAAVTLDFICLRCHNGLGNAAEITSEEILSSVADGMHQLSLPE